MSLDTQFKTESIVVIPLTTGGTVSLSNGLISPKLTPLTDDEVSQRYIITGTQTLSSNFSVSVTTPQENTVLEFLWVAVATPGAFSASINGTTIPAYLLGKKFTLKSVYSSGSWINTIQSDVTQTEGIDGQSIVDSSLGTSKLANSSVTETKIGTGAITVSKIGSSAVEEAKINAGAVTEAKIGSGAVTEVKIGTGAVTEAKIGSGAVTSSKIGAGAVTADKVAFTGLIASSSTAAATTAVTTEEVLYSQAIAANTLSTNGGVLRFRVGISAASNANTKTVRLKLNGQTFYDSSAAVPTITDPNNGKYFLDFEVQRTSSTAAIINGVAVIAVAAGAETAVGLGALGSLDWTASMDFHVTGQNGSASAGDINFQFATITISK